VTGLFIRHLAGAEVVGCDIDSEAVAWCRNHLAPGRFVTIPTDPPTPFESESFDVVLSHSVFTHLTRDRQERWLVEMRRVLRPGGYFLASVSGDFAAQPPTPSPVRAQLERDGISDEEFDDALDDIAPSGYYRTVYQTESFTRRSFGRLFEIVDYLSQGMSHYQDLVIMRKPT
jgi:SAM-dependent methyltransferase